MATFKIVIPTYKDIGLFENCLKGIDVDKRHLIVVDNSKDSYTKRFEKELEGATVYHFPQNIGVSRAWNIGLKAGADWTFFVSQSVVFPEGFSEVLAELQNATEYALITDMAWHCNAISRKCVDTIGVFDDNFYPAYYEDTDYVRRMVLAGMEIKVVKTTGIGVRQAASIDNGLHVDYRQLGEYYKEKWGGYPGHETFDLPFNNPDFKLSSFTSDSIQTLKDKYKL